VKRGRVIAAIVVVAILAGGGALVWLRSRPHWISRDFGDATLTPSGELIVSTGNTIARSSPSGVTTPIATVRNARHLVASSTHAFWTEKLGPKIMLRRAPLSGGPATDVCEVTKKVQALAASKDRVFWMNDAHDVMSEDKVVAHDAHCIAADDDGAFAATTAGIVRLETGEIAFAGGAVEFCELLLSPTEVWLATWTENEDVPVSILKRAPRAGGTFAHVRMEANVSRWFLAGGTLVWTTNESRGKDRDGIERRVIVTHVLRGNDKRVVASGDTEWVGGSGDTLYLLEPDGLRAVTLR
jgi:hypothetical protein